MPTLAQAGAIRAGVDIGPSYFAIGPSYVVDFIASGFEDGVLGSCLRQRGLAWN